MAESIGIKLADGSFYPILDDGEQNQELELTTIRDNQKTVQIDVFRKKDEMLPEYVGSLIVENVVDKPAGEPTISLKLKVDENNNLSAEAVDLDSDSRQALKVSLEPVAIISDMNDFNVMTSESSIEATDNDEKYAYSNNIIDEYDDTKRSGLPAWVMVILMLLGIVCLIIAILLFTRGCKAKNPVADLNKTEQITTKTNDTTSVPPTPSENEKVAAAKREEAKKHEEAKKLADVKKAEEDDKKAKAQKLADAKKAEEDAQRLAEAKKAEEAQRLADAKKAEEAKKLAEASKNKLETTASGAVKYKLKWGDTLWDLSETFYKTPWDYKKIADYNSIKNPSYIIAGTYINIPPK